MFHPPRPLVKGQCFSGGSDFRRRGCIARMVLERPFGVLSYCCVVWLCCGESAIFFLQYLTKLLLRAASLSSTG